MVQRAFTQQGITVLKWTMKEASKKNGKGREETVLVYHYFEHYINGFGDSAIIGHEVKWAFYLFSLLDQALIDWNNP